MADDRVLMLELGLKQLQERCDALHLVLSWLLAKHPDDEALKFLRCQTLEYMEEAPEKKAEAIAVLDALDEDVEHWHALWSSPPDTPGPLCTGI